ncbi:hypothetical protein Tdes44962_MAKER03129 [Teratosphaeria destructans]|uniref:Uncharacterized protein n=1 Tax=Teratosphaeria destructans TaxID=418781 RepID=A0A9W7SR38_9PEZI|nr:hypothetical protein Tdes44962_MAKER03129 [Teratosphaeria destructans]
MTTGAAPKREDQLLLARKEWQFVAILQPRTIWIALLKRGAEGKVNPRNPALQGSEKLKWRKKG